jgi:hypothetical protein
MTFSLGDFGAPTRKPIHWFSTHQIADKVKGKKKKPEKTSTKKGNKKKKHELVNKYLDKQGRPANSMVCAALSVRG